MSTITLTLMYKLERSNLLDSVLLGVPHRVDDPHVTILRGVVKPTAKDYEATLEEKREVVSAYVKHVSDAYQTGTLNRPTWVSAHGLSFFYPNDTWVPVLLVRDRNDSLYDARADAAHLMGRLRGRDEWTSFVRSSLYDYIPHVTLAPAYDELADAVNSMGMLAVPNAMDVGLPVTSVVLLVKVEGLGRTEHTVWRAPFYQGAL